MWFNNVINFSRNLTVAESLSCIPLFQCDPYSAALCPLWYSSIWTDNLCFLNCLLTYFPNLYPVAVFGSTFLQPVADTSLCLPCTVAYLVCRGFQPERSRQRLGLLFLFLAFTTILYTRSMSVFRFLFCQRAFLFQLQACVIGTNL